MSTDEISSVEAPPPGPNQFGLLPVMAGTFAIYEDTDGGMVLVADVAGQGVTRRKIPAQIVSMLHSGGGPVGRMLRRAFGVPGE